MRNFNYSIEGDKRGRMHGVFYVDEEHIVRDYDAVAKDFSGVYINANFDELAYNEDAADDIREFFKMLAIENSARICTLLRDRHGIVRLLDIIGTKNVRETSCFDIEFWDVTNVESGFTFYYDNVWKYRVMLGLTGNTLFDLNIETGIITFFRYVGKKSIRIYYGDIKDFSREVIDYADQDSKNIQAIEQFCNQLIEGANTIETSFKTALLHKDKKMQTLKVSARFDDMNGHFMMYGTVIATNDTFDDIPYYMTSAGMDPMTGLLNKRSIAEYTEDIIGNSSNSKRIHYLILLDIDDFKSINDNYGHQTGDLAILALSSVISECVKDTGIIGRFGGDEFYIFTDTVQNEDTLRTTLRAIRENLLKKAKEKLGIEKMTLSMGVAMYPDHGHSYNELFGIADKCLYIAKEKGKNRYIIYRPEIHQNIQTGAERKGISSYDEQSKAINQVVRDLFLEGREAIGDSLNLVVKGFDLDNVDVFYGKDLDSLFNCGKYPSGLVSTDFTDNSKYMEQFDSTGLYVMNNFNNHKRTIPEIYDMLQKHNCMSLIQMALPSASMPEFFISFNMLNRIHKWSEAEISNLSLFGTLLYETIKRRR